jgi:hypothetical protein
MNTCTHKNKSVGYESVSCNDCGWHFCDDLDWPARACNWYPSISWAYEYVRSGILPDEVKEHWAFLRQPSTITPNEERAKESME